MEASTRKAVMGRAEVLRALRPLDAEVVNVPQSRFTKVRVGGDAAEVVVGRAAYPLEKEGRERLWAFTGIPTKVAEAVKPDTLGRLATDLLEGKGDFAIIRKDGAVQSVVPAVRGRVAPVEQVLGWVEAVTPEVRFNRALVLPNYQARVEIATEETVPVAKGDLIRGGALVGFSPYGTVEPYVQSFALRLACTNGATTMDVMREFHFGNGSGGMGEWMRKAVSAAYRAAEKVAARWAAMMKRPVSADERAQILAALLRKAGIAGKPAEAVHALALREPPENEYDMLQLMTWATSHALEEPRAIWRAQNVASEFQTEDQHARICPACNRATS